VQVGLRSYVWQTHSRQLKVLNAVKRSVNIGSYVGGEKVKQVGRAEWENQ